MPYLEASFQSEFANNNQYSVSDKAIPFIPAANKQNESLKFSTFNDHVSHLITF
jgi:hypothetical protein